MLMCKDTCLITQELQDNLPSIFVEHLQEFKDVFPKATPKELPVLREIKQKIDFTLRA